MAVRLDLTYDTILTHFRHIRKILNVHNTREILQVIESVECHASFDNIILTPRGTEVFKLFLQGLTHQDIACRLGIMQNTVRRHKEYMLLRNNCNTMTELVSKYYGGHATQNIVENIDA